MILPMLSKDPRGGQGLHVDETRCQNGEKQGKGGDRREDFYVVVVIVFGW